MALPAMVPAWGHHSFALYDGSKKLEVTGTVMWVEWASPHNYLRLIKDDRTVLRMEFGMPGVNLRMGWKPDSIKVGQKIVVTYAPKMGDPLAGSIAAVTLPDGKTLRTPVYYVYNSLPTPPEAEP